MLAIHPPKEWSGEQLSEFGALLEVTNAEDPQPEAVEALRELVRQNPEIWQQAGDLGVMSHGRLAEYASAAPLVQEGILMMAKELRQQLERATDTALEKLVIEQCVSAYILHYAIEMRYASKREGGFVTSVDGYWDRRLNASQMRYFRAMETLARLRRMALPAMQINIGANQTNIATGGVVIAGDEVQEVVDVIKQEGTET